MTGGGGTPSRVTRISMFSSLHSECRHLHGSLLHRGTSDGQPAQGLLTVVHLRIQGVQVRVPLPPFDIACPSRRKCEKGQCVPDVRGGGGGTVLPLSAASFSVLLSPAHRAWLIALGCPVLTGASVAFPSLKSKTIQMCSQVCHSCLTLGKAFPQVKGRFVVGRQMRARD